MTTHRYHTSLVVLHWLLGFMILLGLIMGTFSLERLPNSQPEKLDSLRGHVINGLAIGVLMIVRLIVRSLTRRPAPPRAAEHWLFLDKTGGSAGPPFALFRCSSDGRKRFGTRP
jgi:cytochrome b561